MFLHIECGNIQQLLDSLNYFEGVNDTTTTNTTKFLIKNKVTTLLNGIQYDLGDRLVNRFTQLSNQYQEIITVKFPVIHNYVIKILII